MTEATKPKRGPGRPPKRRAPLAPGLVPTEAAALKWKPKYDAIIPLDYRGMKYDAIAAELGMSRSVVWRVRRHPEYAERMREYIDKRDTGARESLQAAMAKRQPKLLRRFDELVEQTEDPSTAFRAIKEGFEWIEPAVKTPQAPMVQINLSGDVLEAMHAAVEKRDRAKALLIEAERTEDE